MESAKPTTVQQNDPLWYKDAVIYQLHVKSFFDANNDGEGDFKGLISKLDYIAELGVNTVWLLPFYPSPRRDDGYDIADYRGVHEGYGNLADVRQFIRAAHERGLRVITELVVNHTSDQHPWFQRARRAKPGSAARNYYVWSDNDQAYAGTRIIFCDTENSNWTWDPVAGAYFWHRFYSHQPDLNYDNPQVLKEILNVMRYWLNMGVDGLRLDAVPYLVEREGTNNENLPETHAVLRKIRAVMDEEFPGRLLLAEANQWPEDAQEYFGQGDECHMSFHFPLMPRMYMAIARADRFPITDIMQQTPEIPASCQWAIFLRNHDELTLEMVTSSERDYLWEVYAADRRARINLGIRRRLAPLLERDRRRIELMNSLLLSMPGTPVLYYGDEIGMGDNIHLGDRDGVRTPMQWTPDRNGGFSRADPERLQLPVLMGPLYGYEAVNVEAQQRDPHSLLNWTRRMLAKRQQTHAFGRGSLRFLFPGNRKILAYLREYEGVSLLCVANLSNASQPVELNLPLMAGRVPIELLGGTAFPTIGELPYLLTLPPYGFYWFDLSASASPPSWHASMPEQLPDYVTLVWRSRASHPFADDARRRLAQDVLPLYLTRQRWFPGDIKPASAAIAYLAPLPGQTEMWLAEVDVEQGEGKSRYFLPLAMFWSEAPGGMAAQYAIARVRRVSDVGMVTDAYTMPGFALALIESFSQQRRIPVETSDGEDSIEFNAEPALQAMDWSQALEVSWFHGEQSNSSVLVGDQAILKILRHIVPGVHPEAEMTRQLSQNGFGNVAALLGEMRRVDASGTPHTLALLHQRIENQGDAWAWTQDYLKRILENAALTLESEADYEEELLSYRAVAATMGRRLAQMHAVLAKPTSDAAFAPENATERDARVWLKAIQGMVDQAIKNATDARASLPVAAQAQLTELQAWRPALRKTLEQRVKHLVGTQRIRIHGDFHLGQVLIAQGDVYLIDFEGEPVRPLAERRLKATPWRDVAGMLRSFDYASATFVAQAIDAVPASTNPTDEMAEEPQTGPAAATLQSLRHELLERFCQSASSAFLDGYAKALDEAVGPQAAQAAITPVTTSSAMATWPEVGDHGLLDLALLEKAAYEVCYEAAHRPEWLPIPLAGLHRVVCRIMKPSASGAKEVVA
ncbi:maltose alpha-D-glucosyltransferase [Alcaligenaceae bacterium]|nr:maltose alpha-D-glucosyltransferase [Alcaligenaceae bacterium]